jgi:hypothetical protein
MCVCNHPSTPGHPSQEGDLTREKRAAVAEVPQQVNALSNILIIHPGSRNLRFGRASDFYPKEIPNCIARPANAPHRGSDPPVPGSRIKRLAQEDAERREAKRRKAEQGEDGMDEDVAVDAEEEEDEGPWVDPVSSTPAFITQCTGRSNADRPNRLTRTLGICATTFATSCAPTDLRQITRREAGSKPPMRGSSRKRSQSTTILIA